MRFKLLGIQWDFTPLIGMIWVMWGCFTIASPFMFKAPDLPSVAFWAIIVSDIIFIGSMEAIGKKITGGME